MYCKLKSAKKRKKEGLEEFRRKKRHYLTAILLDEKSVPAHSRQVFDMDIHAFHLHATNIYTYQVLCQVHGDIYK